MEAKQTTAEITFEEITSEVDDRQSSPAAYEIATYPADFTLEGIEWQWQAEEIEIPRFQRGFVSSQAQASEPDRLGSILRAWRRAVMDGKAARVTYFCSNRAADPLRRAVERTRSERVVAVYGLPG